MLILGACQAPSLPLDYWQPQSQRPHTNTMSEAKEVREITEAELPAALKEHWKNAKASVERNNHGYAIKFLQAILKEEPGFLNARKLVRQAEIIETGAIAGGGKKSLFGGGASGSFARQAKKDPSGALVSIEKELEKEPFNVGVNEVLHDVALRLNLLDTAAFALETARKGHPENTKVAHKLAHFYVARDMHMEASVVYRDIVKQDAGDGTAVKGEKDCSAKASMQKNRMSENSSFKDMLKGDEAAELEKAARTALTKDQLEERAGELSAQYEADPNNLAVVKQLALTYEQLEDWNTSYQFYSWAHELSNGDVALRSKANEIKDRAAEQYIKDVELAAAADPDNAELQTQMKEIQQARIVERLEECHVRVKQNPTDPKMRFDLGQALYDAGDYSDAIPHLQQATRNPHIRIKVLLLLGRTFDAKSMTDLAIKQLKDASDELSQMDATKKEVLYELGVIYAKAERKDEALDCFKQIYEVDYGYRDVAARVEGSYSE
ncbi:MAG: tetratricopeptide (TPR) repeat protein [Akkermansiaceae bacterium]|jgi:tetratricopeptide (TPR) repeat protein